MATANLPSVGSLTGVQTPTDQLEQKKKQGVVAQARQQAQVQTMAQTAPAQPQQQTFAQLQAAGQARPAPPPAPAPVAQPQWPQAQQVPQGPQNNSTNLRSQISQMLANPSYFTNDLFQQQLRRGTEDLDDRFKGEETSLREDMARRGLSDSSIYGGRMQDLNVSKRSAGVDLLQRLGLEMAKANDEGRYRAVSAATDVERMDQEAALANAKLALEEKVANGQLSLAQAQLAFQKLQHGDDMSFKRDSLTEDTRRDNRDFAFDQERFGYQKGEDDRNFRLRMADLYGTDTVDYGDSDSVPTGNSGMSEPAYFPPETYYGPQGYQGGYSGFPYQNDYGIGPNSLYDPSAFYRY
jgi:hypothetical protein